ncbi:hypothetical protein GCM10009613_09640 [Pseudonocardia kongjuensis]|uniref:4Fe-4S ferredoxin-type domain-containing protein n=1 Tax=Pseudonocardia kongjuensis TaxID=102227 RepID=A0ABP4I5K6_9PSEU
MRPTIVTRRPWMPVLHRIKYRIALSGLPAWLGSDRVQAVLRQVDRIPVRPFRHRYMPRTGPRSLQIPELPEAWKGEPGVPRDRTAAEADIAAHGRPPTFFKLHHEAFALNLRQKWPMLLGHLTRLGKDVHAAIAERPDEPAVVATRRDPADLTAGLKERAAEIGFSAIGITAPDLTVTYSDQDLLPHERHVVVCVLEPSWEATQAIPGRIGENTEFATVFRLRELCLELADHLNALGYRARIDNPRVGHTVAYGVEAGLGQLGLNGQLLTPFAGSRGRLSLIFTDAPLVDDGPRDFGVPALCDECRVCVPNCPPRAIRSRRDWHHGVYKAAVKPERCFPVVTTFDGCGICQKVCPVQRYGLPAVIEEFHATGRILGKGTDELEGYWWPGDGRYYGPGQAPRPDPEMLSPEGFVMDPARTDYAPEVKAQGQDYYRRRAVGTVEDDDAG